jgi:outer membrane receptor for ferric coprogen and ferric-rhodotorulic acid
VLVQTPGVTDSLAGSEIGGYQVFYSRGYRIDNYQLDGALAPSSAFGGGWQGNNSLDTAVYDSVVVVRGATGLLTGAGDPTGSINLVRKRPTREFQASIEQGFGRWNIRLTSPRTAPKAGAGKWNSPANFLVAGSFRAAMPGS